MADRRRQDENNERFESDDVTTNSSRRNGEIGLAQRLSEILVADGDGDLLLQQSDRDNNFMQWLQALDLQVMGACRADERLKPLLKVNTSTGAAEDRLLAHLSQHFDASEVGLLARCLCVPLVSMRVGKVVKQGTLLCPTSVRGTLNLTLLPSSDLRISFVGDDGFTQRLAALCHASESSDVFVEEISADHSGRSFLVKVPGGEIFYFWCSEKSKLLGIELLYKMKDLLEKKPSLPELTGISKSRLECFATNLRSYVVGANLNNQANIKTSSVPWLDTRPDTNSRPLPASVRQLRSRHNGCQTLKGHTQYQVNLSPRSSSFKEGLPKTHLKVASREKFRRRGDLQLPLDNSMMKDAVTNHSDPEHHLEGSESLATSPLSFLESLGNCTSFPSISAKSEFPPISSLMSPYYCWCPPCTSPINPPILQLPTSMSAEPFSLPPLSSLLPPTATTSLLSLPSLDLAGGGSPLELPTFISDPLARLPFPTQSSQQISTFIPLMCDPIVHIPILDVCSSGQGYLVSGGPGLATSIPPLHPKLVGPMMPESDSMVDKGARETLRLLIGGSASQASASLMNVLPAVLNENKQDVMVTGSRGLYSGTSDVGAIVNSFAAVGLASLSDKPLKVSSTLDELGQVSGGFDLQDSTSKYLSTEEKKDC